MPNVQYLFSIRFTHVILRLYAYCYNAVKVVLTSETNLSVTSSKLTLISIVHFEILDPDEP